jgi:hypothetical protein
MGLGTLLPGLLVVGLAPTRAVLYLGLTFLSVGSAMVIPCLTTLISLYSPGNRQGEVIGVFRSLGALARVIGPLSMAIIYWKYGSSFPYFIGALILLIPLYLISRLPMLRH